MVRPETGPRSSSNQSPQTAPPLSSAAQLNHSIDGALQSIRQQRRLLRQVRDGGYDIARAEQQVLRLVEVQEQLEQLLEQIVTVDEADLETIRQSYARARSQLSQLKASEVSETSGNPTNAQLPTKKALKQQLQAITLQLQTALHGIEAELEEVGEGNPTVDEQREQVAELQRSLEHEQQLIAIGDLGQSRKAILLKQLHQLMLLVYRLRQLAQTPRLQRQLSQLNVTALQIQDTVQELDLEASNASELLESSLYVLERRLAQFEYDRRLGLIPLPVSWLINRYRDVASMQSVQARVLSGLGFSLALSGVTFFVLTVPLTLVSGYASRSQDGIRKELAEKQRVFTVAVSEFIQLEQEGESLQTRLANVNTQIASETAQKVAQSTAIKTPQAISQNIATTNAEAESLSVDRSLEEDVTDGVAAAEEDSTVEVEVSASSRLLQIQAELLVKQSNNEERIQKQRAEMVQQLRGIQSLYAALSGDLLSLQASAAEEAAQARQAENSTTETPSTGNAKAENPSTGNSSTENPRLTSLANFITDKGLLDHSRRILLAAFAGALGSMMSILIRLDQMEKEDVKNPFLLGALKPVIGAVFGIAVFAILSTRVIDILPSSFYLYERQLSEVRGDTGAGTLPAELRGDPLGELDSQELYKIFLVAFLAGFSERLANDTLKSVGSTRSLG